MERNMKRKQAARAFEERARVHQSCNWLLVRNGELTITWPPGRVNADELSEALDSTA